MRGVKKMAKNNIPARKSGWIEMNLSKYMWSDLIPARKSGWIEIHCHAYVTASCHSRSQERVDRSLKKEGGC